MYNTSDGGLHSVWAALLASLWSEWLVKARQSCRHCARPLSVYMQGMLTVGGADLLLAQICKQQQVSNYHTSILRRMAMPFVCVCMLLHGQPAEDLGHTKVAPHLPGQAA